MAYPNDHSVWSVFPIETILSDTVMELTPNLCEDGGGLDFVTQGFISVSNWTW